MTSFPEHPDVDYSVCGSADVDELARLLGEVFSKRDPPAYTVGLSAKEFEDFVRLFGTTTAAGGLTVIARYRKGGDMVGALLTEDCAGGKGIRKQLVQASRQTVTIERSIRIGPFRSASDG